MLDISCTPPADHSGIVEIELSPKITKYEPWFYQESTLCFIDLLPPWAATPNQGISTPWNEGTQRVHYFHGSAISTYTRIYKTHHMIIGLVHAMYSWISPAHWCRSNLTYQYWAALMMININIESPRFQSLSPANATNEVRSSLLERAASTQRGDFIRVSLPCGTSALLLRIG